MAAFRRRSQPSSRRTPPTAFLNLPYHPHYQQLFLAYIAGLSGFGLLPRATLEISGSRRRLDRIMALIDECDYSLHDLSCVSLDRRSPATPRFNMPFELGLAVRSQNDQNGGWFVFEGTPYRIQKSLSDLNGTDPYVHDGTPEGVLREIMNAFSRRPPRPQMGDLRQIYSDLQRAARKIRRDRRSSTIFEADTFNELVLAAQISTEERLAKRRGSVKKKRRRANR